ncbi:MAG: helix-turn-helix transcriptional regulator [Planctomycetes bacterium]|nr:helix-turn-helix transcriptional regulator [Planctomycetota bacterium]
MKPFRTFYVEPPIDTAELSIHALGLQEWMSPRHIDRPAGTGDHLFMHFHQETFIGSDAQARVWPAHTLIVWPPGHGQFYGSLTGRWCHSWMHCDGDAIARALSAAEVPLSTPIVGVDPDILETGVHAMHEEIRGHSPPDAVIVDSFVQILVRGLGRVARARSLGPSIPTRWLEMRRHLEAHFAEPLRLADLAQRARCSVPHFCSEFKRHFRISAIEFAIRLRVHRATILLRDRNLDVGEIAALVGYEDVHHFSKLFKKHTGSSPMRLRERWADESQR